MGDLRVTRLVHDGEELIVVSTPVERERGPLSPAETAVARMVAEGLSNAEIARRRGRSERTVANQIARILRKLGVDSRHQIATKGFYAWPDARPRRR